MDLPTVTSAFAAAPGTYTIPTYWPVPGVGTLPMNAFLVRAAEPVLVDTGTGALSGDFLSALADLIDPVDLRWIWLTHEDRDHTGSLQALLDLAPRATVVGTWLSFGRYAPDGPLPLRRIRVLNPGDVLNAGDRNLHALRPPLYDSPGTLGFLDDSTGALFSSDCFGAPLPDEAAATAPHADDVPPQELLAGQVAWATVDSPWVTMTAQDRLRAAVDRIRRLAPSTVLSTHLPPVRRAIEASLTAVETARTAEPVPGATQIELELLLGQFTPAEPEVPPLPTGTGVTTTGGNA
jgi:glyoxylase-like metal-dependent hydrolase (beta-lactamase superfamily II)